MIDSHRDLQVWQKAMDLVVVVYEVSRSLPDSERFGLISQMRRAATSVPANIAEGKARGTTKSFLNFLSIADGSLSELDTHLEVAVRLGYITRDTQQPLVQRMAEVGRMLTGLRRSLARKLT
ncbi:MAG: four helix bundle protein [Candidatus Saccharimonas sp.]|nr:four helix bundle protein [Planctomycetaceae bacterium]